MEECVQCGRCCSHLRKGDETVGLTLFPEEIHPFPESTVKPHLGKGIEGHTKVFTYQHTENVCVNLRDNLCTIYDRRPLMCRSFPVKVGARGLTFSPGCKAFIKTVKNSKKSKNRDMEEVRAALEIAERLYKFHSSLEEGEGKFRYNLLTDMWETYGYIR